MKDFFLREKTMLAIVLINVIVIFLQGCGLNNIVFSTIDIVCTLLFVVEMVIKHFVYGFKGYWHDGWNVLDGVVTIISLPALLAYFVPSISEYSFIIVFRALRVFKMFRTARRFPNIKEIWAGFRLAMQQSAAFLLGYFIIIVVIAMFNNALFSKAAPEYFSTPLDGIYAMFQMFTVEGWYEIPNAVVGNMSPVWMHVVRIYFCILLIGGGIIGMSLINSIFVDAMAADNNDDVKTKLDKITQTADENNSKMLQEIEELKRLLKEK